ncbi:MAG: RHS repeat-associated core domain-containing protein [Chloroflexota bacterium]
MYDSATNGKGQLATVSWGASPTQNKDTFVYDSFGRLTKQTRLIDGTSYALETTGFDVLSRPLTVKYPTNEVVTLTYDREGENTLKAGSNDLVSALTYNARGQMLKLDRAGSAVDTTYAYYNATGTSGNSNFRLKTMAHGGNTDVWPDMAYTYDTVGNILTLNTTASGVAADNQLFGYDDLSRLTSACTVVSGTTCGNSGPAPYTVTYGYNEIGNIMSFEGSSYDYNNVSWNTNCTAPSQAMPHAVRKIGSQYFCYDANGNMTKRFDGTTTYTQNFDVENRLVSVVVGSSTTTFAYDASGQRVKTVEPGGKTTYFPFLNYEETVVGSSTIKRSSYAIAGQVVAFRVAGDPVTTNNGLFFIYGDHLGSTTMLGTSGGAFVAGSLARYRPYGSYRTAPTQTLTDRDFTGQRENREIGLLYYNARFYIPSIGRFASADTIVPSPANPQSFNRYSYVLNSPINFVDPTGHRSCSAEDTASGDETCDSNIVDSTVTPLTSPIEGHALEPIGNVNLSAYVFALESEFNGQLRNVPGISGIQAKDDFLFSRGGVVMQGTGVVQNTGQKTFIHITNAHQLYWVDSAGNKIIHQSGQWVNAETGTPGQIARIGNPQDAIFALGTGRDLTPYYSVAGPSEYEMGTLIYIPQTISLTSTNGVFEVQDRGGAIEGRTFDVFVGQGFANSDHWFANRPQNPMGYMLIPISTNSSCAACQ